uniref:Uncharacterized protein n=1 Tax=Romanomermis culicivorax TaxID=13658 RepID=A0A915LCT2_ROMCU
MLPPDPLEPLVGSLQRALMPKRRISMKDAYQLEGGGIMSSFDWLNPDYIRHLLHNCGFKINDLITHLEQTYPNTSGLSEHNIKRFCSQHQISSHNLIGRQYLETVVLQLVNELQMYGIIYVVASNGLSFFVTSYTVMPK